MLQVHSTASAQCTQRTTSDAKIFSTKILRSHSDILRLFANTQVIKALGQVSVRKSRSHSETNYEIYDKFRNYPITVQILLVPSLVSGLVKYLYVYYLYTGKDANVSTSF
jgi:hypothetical protein